MKKLNKTTVKHRLPLVHADSAKLAHLITGNILKAHEATGHTTISEHLGKMHRAVQKACCDDARFCTPPTPQAGQMQSGYIPKPYVVDITTPDEGGQHHAIIQTAKGELVRHGFDFNKDEGTATLVEGNSTPTERTSIYARECDRHQNMVKATHETISCRATGGVKLSASEPWESGKSVSYIYAPGGITTISAGFRKNESITCTVCVDEDTAKDLQDSFDFIAATEKQEPYADEDHEAKKATLRFPPGKVEFTYGTHRGEEGVIVKGAEPTSYGAEAVNGKTYASWSPEFATDADYDKAKCKKGHWTFPDGVRGSASNPARLIAVNFVTGALTNKPAFRNMPPVKAKLADVNADEADKIFATLFKDDAEREAFSAQHPSIGWLRAAIGLDDGNPVVATDATETGDVVAAAGTSEGVKKGWETRLRNNSSMMKMEESKKALFNTLTSGLYSDAKMHAGQSSSAADAASKSATSKEEHALAYTAHMNAREAHTHARTMAEKNDSSHDEQIQHHKKQIELHHAEFTKRESTKATDATTGLDAILARQSANHEAVEKLAARVPATATRAGLDAILARQTVTGTGEVVKAGAPMGNKNAEGHGNGNAPSASEAEKAFKVASAAAKKSQGAWNKSSEVADDAKPSEHAGAAKAHQEASEAHLKAATTPHTDAKYHQSMVDQHSAQARAHIEGYHFPNGNNPALKPKSSGKGESTKATSTTEPTLETLYARVGANGQTR